MKDDRKFVTFISLKKMRLLRISLSLLFNIPLQILAAYILYKYDLTIHEELNDLKCVAHLMVLTIISHFICLFLRFAVASRCMKESIVRDVIQIIYCAVTVVNIFCAIQIIFFNRRLPKDINPDLIPPYRRITATLRKVCQFLEAYSTLFIIYWTIGFTYKVIKKERANH